MVSKRFVVFIVDLVPSETGYLFMLPTIIIDMLPPLLEAIAKAWYRAGENKQVKTPNLPVENPWSSYSDEYITKLRQSPTKRAYIAAKTSTGKSTMNVAALYAARHRMGVRKIWLVEPRKILREETIIPFNIPTQILMRGVARSESTDIYKLTYGHLQSRLLEIDNEKDIVLFDEFHEEQGEMILGLNTVKAPIFLMSATPVNIPALKGTPFLMPNIDRRHPIKVHKVPDDMPIIDMFMMGANTYPEQIKRSMVIVPTKKEARKIINSLLYLGFDAHEVSSDHRKIPETGVIVATPYVQTGADIKPPVKLLINSGKDLVIDKGVLKTENASGKRGYPWTTPDINNQRVGRVGRLETGIVIEPISAGTGTKPVLYPSPNMFMHKCVSDHFGVPQLTPIPGAINSQMPFLRINHNRLNTIQAQKSVALIHAFAFAGIRQTEWSHFYERKVRNKNLGEDYEFVERVFSDYRWKCTPLLPWDQANYFLNMEHVVQVSIGGKAKWTTPIIPMNDMWVEVEKTPTIHLKIELNTNEQVYSKYEKQAKILGQYKNALLQYANKLGDAEFSRVVKVIG